MRSGGDDRLLLRLPSSFASTPFERSLFHCGVHHSFHLAAVVELRGWVDLRHVDGDQVVFRIDPESSAGSPAPTVSTVAVDSESQAKLKTETTLDIASQLVRTHLADRFRFENSHIAA